MRMWTPPDQVLLALLLTDDLPLYLLFPDFAAPLCSLTCTNGLFVLVTHLHRQLVTCITHVVMGIST